MLVRQTSRSSLLADWRYGWEISSVQTSNLIIAASAIGTRTEIWRTLVESWTRLCFIASRIPWATNCSLNIGLPISMSLIAITKDPEIIFDPGGTSSLRTSSYVSLPTRFSISCLRARSAYSPRILRSLWCGSSVMRTLGISLQLTVEDFHGRLDYNLCSDQCRIVTRCSPDIILSYVDAGSTWCLLNLTSRWLSIMNTWVPATRITG